MTQALETAVVTLRALPRFAKATWRREYKEFPWRSVLIVAATILYVVLPTDLIPDFIPVFGWADDWAVVALALKTLASDVSRFREWEAATVNATPPA